MSRLRSLLVSAQCSLQTCTLTIGAVLLLCSFAKETLPCCCRYTDFIPSGSNNTGGIRALRALRALRPLRTITRFESLRAIVVSFLEVRARGRETILGG